MARLERDLMAAMLPPVDGLGAWEALRRDYAVGTRHVLNLFAPFDRDLALTEQRAPYRFCPSAWASTSRALVVSKVVAPGLSTQTQDSDASTGCGTRGVDHGEKVGGHITPGWMATRAVTPLAHAPNSRGAPPRSTRRARLPLHSAAPYAMTITVRADVRIARPVDVVFALAAGRTANLARFFTGNKPLIPAIRSAALVGQEDPPTPGALRDVALSDGTSIQERVLAFEASRLHRYDMAKMNRLQKLICTNMVSEWRFEADGEGASRVSWEYAIHDRGIMGRLAGPLVARQFQRAMQSCLDNIARAALAG
jgi:hypothetical protein